MSQPGALEPDLPRRGWAQWLLIAALIAVLLAIATSVWLWVASVGALDRHIAAIHARGEPATFAEIEATLPALAPEQDATELLLAASRDLRAATATPLSQQLPVLGHGAPAPRPGHPWAEAALVKQFLTDHDQSRQALHTAADRGGRVRLHLAASLQKVGDLGNVLEYVQNLRTCARLLELETQFRTHEGDVPGAVRAIRATFLLAAGADEALLVSQLVNIAVFKSAADRLKRLVLTVDVPADELALLQQTIENMDFHASLKQALFGERAFAILFFRELGNGSALRSALAQISMAGAQSYYFEKLAELIDATPRPWPELVDVAASASPSPPSSMFAPGAAIAASFIDAVRPAIKLAARAELIRQELIAILATERYRRDQGHPPAGLDELVPRYLSTFPTDPGTGAPLSYDKTERGYAIYTSSLKLQSGPNEQPEQQYGALPAFLFIWSPDGPPAEEPALAPVEDEPEAIVDEPPPDDVPPAEAATP